MKTLCSEPAVSASPQTEVPHPDMVWIGGGTFRMGSDRHYPEEAPVHRVTVDGFWMDRTPVTNRQFRAFVRATGHVTFAETRPDPKDYPGALPHMLYAGSLVFTPPDHPVDLRLWGEWWTSAQRRRLAPPLWPEEHHQRARQPSGRARDLRRRAGLCALGRQGSADRGGVGVRRPRRARRAEFAWGDELDARRPSHGQHLAGQFPCQNLSAGRLRAHIAGHGLPAQRLRALTT